jgi:hypothetical protein
MTNYQRRFLDQRYSKVVLTGLLTTFIGISTLGCSKVCAQDTSTNTQASGGLNAQVATDTGVAVNGNVDDSNINSNQTNVNTGSNTNLNVISPNVLTPTHSQSSGGAAAGGNAVLMLPRNPLPLGNAALGRSNFGLQFGLQNNPILGGLSGQNGQQSALGWFMQAGLTIPFGKIPDALTNRQTTQFDDVRQTNLDRQRDVFGTLTPGAPQQPNNVDYKVQGKISGMGAYNFTTLPSAKLALPDDTLTGLSSTDVKLPQPKLVAMTPSEVFSKPLNVGDKIGVVDVGSEYPYLGHTRSGWIKILLPNGKEGWTSNHFEYIKHDYTEIDALALDPKSISKVKSAMGLHPYKPGKEKQDKSIR